MPLVHEQIESATTAALFAAACEFQDAAGAKPSVPPRFLLDSARCMARHVGMTEQRMQEILPQLACYQIFLHSALTADPRNFTEAPSRFPAAYHQIRSALDALESHPQLVVCAFHMAAMPLIVWLAWNCGQLVLALSLEAQAFWHLPQWALGLKF